MKKLIMAILLSIAVPAMAQAKPATCLLEEGGKTLYKGKCDFDPQGNGSFFISHPSFAKKLNFAGVMVWIESKNEVYAQISKLESGSYMWGEVTRSQKDKACWVGNGFKICTWAQQHIHKYSNFKGILK